VFFITWTVEMKCKFQNNDICTHAGLNGVHIVSPNHENVDLWGHMYGMQDQTANLHISQVCWLSKRLYVMYISLRILCSELNSENSNLWDSSLMSVFYMFYWIYVQAAFWILSLSSPFKAQAIHSLFQLRI